jgi:hypothetical protein
MTHLFDCRQHVKALGRRLQSKNGIRLIKALFWLFFCKNFQSNSTEQQVQLMQMVSVPYTKLLLPFGAQQSHDQHDVVLQVGSIYRIVTAAADFDRESICPSSPPRFYSFRSTKSSKARRRSSTIRFAMNCAERFNSFSAVTY